MPRMQTTKRWMRSLGVAALLVSACTTETPITEGVTTRTFQQRVVQDLVPPKAEVLSTRKVEIQQRSSNLSYESPRMGPAPPGSPAPERHGEVIEIDFTTGIERTLRFDSAELERFSADIAGLGLSEPSSRTEVADERVEKGWSGGTDGRTNRATPLETNTHASALLPVPRVAQVRW